MFRCLSLTFVVMAAIGPVQAGVPIVKAQHHPRLHHALYELREARVELKTVAHDFDGNREKALRAVDAAILQIDAALHAAGDNVGIKPPRLELYKQYTHHPHMHHALHELREASRELRTAKHDFGGHRDAALRDVNFAIVQIELALKHVR